MLLVKTTETGVNKVYIPFIYMIVNMVSVLLAIPIGKLYDNVSSNALFYFGLTMA